MGGSEIRRGHCMRHSTRASHLRRRHPTVNTPRYVRIVSREEAYSIRESARISPSMESWETEGAEVYEQGTCVFLFDAAAEGWQQTAISLYLGPDRHAVIIFRELQTEEDLSAVGWLGSRVHRGGIDLSSEDFRIVEIPTREAFASIFGGQPHPL